jgi:hypothetical protein
MRSDSRTAVLQQWGASSITHLSHREDLLARESGIRCCAPEDSLTIWLST